MASFRWEGAFLVCIRLIFLAKNNENNAPKFPCLCNFLFTFDLNHY
jgi:hypothetical protein